MEGEQVSSGDGDNRPCGRLSGVSSVLTCQGSTAG